MDYGTAPGPVALVAAVAGPHEMPHGHVDRDLLTAADIPPGHHLLLGISERGMVQFLERKRNLFRGTA